MPLAPSRDHVLARHTISRFVVSTLGMLTAEHEAIDISKLINSGLLSLSQSVVKLAGTVPSADHALYEEVGPNKVPYLRRDTVQEDDDQEGVAGRFPVGTIVVRGPDWKWGDQDGLPPSKGTVISELSSSSWMRVQWDSGTVNSYRMTKDGKRDLEVAPPGATEGESKDTPVDVELVAGMATPYPALDMATSMILQCSVCLLRSLVVAFSVHSHLLPDRTASLLSNLLYHIMECTKKKSESKKNLSEFYCHII